MEKNTNFLTNKLLDAAVWVTSLGYLVDFFDMYLYNMNRVKSLTDLGLSGDALTAAGLVVSNWQMGGFLFGALLWGILADKFGRKFALFPSIFLYSIGSIACAFVHNVDIYGPLRFITAIGLAGELGTGIALISEKLTADKRGYGIIIFISAGFVGAVLAGLTAEFLDWRTAYFVGGVAGLLLLFLRTQVRESDLFNVSRSQSGRRGDITILFKNPKYLWTYLCGIMLIVNGVFVPQILWTLSPEIARAMHVAGEVKASFVIMLGMTAGIFGDFMAASLGEKLKSRKKASIIFLGIGAIAVAAFLILKPTNLYVFYAFNAMIGLVFGVWAITCLWAAEHFGTNIRAIVASTTPNFARAFTIPMNLAFASLKSFGTVEAVMLIAATIFLMAVVGWFGLRETYGKDLNFVE